jgi:hypothetical protein
VSKPVLKLDWCSHEAAKYAVEKWHYSRRMPKSKQVYIGVWEHGEFAGAVITGYSTTPYLGESFDLSQQQAVELTRIALKSGHVSPVSKVLSVVILMLRRAYVGLRLMVSYADPNVGHTGVVYQASNWIYAGTVPGRTQFLIDGVWRNDAPAFRLARQRQFPKRRTAGKHKYLMPLDDDMRRRVAPLARPYPKRVGSAGSGTPAHQAGGGGANPTPALSSPQED